MKQSHNYLLIVLFTGVSVYGAAAIADAFIPASDKVTNLALYASYWTMYGVTFLCIGTMIWLFFGLCWFCLHMW
jgi:ABC-type transport system involved in multi-copper enzyme maturation permease subunit